MRIQKRTVLSLSVLVPTIAALVALCLGIWAWWAASHRPQPLFRPSSQFAVGVNYPWRHYGIDFGDNVWGDHEGVSTPEAEAEVDHDFAYLSSHGLKVVRWFVFCDGRAGLRFNQDGSLRGIDPDVIPDMEAAVTIAHKYKIRLIFVLIDYNFAQPAVWLDGKKVGGHKDVIEDPHETAVFENEVLAPILRKFGNSPDIAAWEIINEPEWVMTRFPVLQPQRVSVAKMQSFVASTALFIKARSHQQVTVGSASMSDLKYWQKSNLDFLQFHSYPYLDGRNPLDTPAMQVGHGIPVVLGEFPTKGTEKSIARYFQLMSEHGYSGALAWSYRASDKYSGLNAQLPALAEWLKAHNLAAKGEPVQTAQMAGSRNEPAL